MPETQSLTEAIMTHSVWVKAWLGFLAVVFAASLPFVAVKTPTDWRPQWEAITIPLSMVLGVVVTEWLYSIYGFSRILGLGHLIAWTPFYVWIVVRRRRLEPKSWFAKYLLVYVVAAVVCLAIDAVDVARYLMGETGQM